MLEWEGGETKGFCTEGTKNMLCVSLGSSITDYKPDWIFCFAFKCFFSQCGFFKLFFLSVFLGDRASLGLFIWSIHPIHKAAQAIFSRLISSTIPYGFATAKPLCLIPKWKGQASCAVSSSPVPAGLSAGCRNSVRATAVRVVKHLCGDWQKLFWGSKCLLLWWWHGTW